MSLIFLPHNIFHEKKANFYGKLSIYNTNEWTILRLRIPKYINYLTSDEECQSKGKHTVVYMEKIEIISQNTKK